MMYCPRCGLEQRCGCEECHRCGAKLQRGDEAEAHTLPVEADVRKRESGKDVGIKEGVRTGSLQAPRPESSSPKLGHVLLFIVFLAGVCLIILSLIQALSRADDFIRNNYGLVLLNSGKNVGYFLGSLIYGASLSLVVGFVFLLFALFSRPPLPFSKTSTWEKYVFSMCAIMFLLFLAGLISVILMLVPGRQSLILKNFIPPAVLSVPAILAFSLFMLVSAVVCGYRVIDLREGYEEANPNPSIG